MKTIKRINQMYSTRVIKIYAHVAIAVVAVGVFALLQLKSNDSIPARAITNEKPLAAIGGLSRVALITDKTKATFEKNQKDIELARVAAENAKVDAQAVKKAQASYGPHSNPSSMDVIVNKKHPMNPVSFTPNVQTTLCAGTSSATLSTVTVTDFSEMCNAAAAAGSPLSVTSSFRSYQSQVETYNYWVNINGQAGADRVSARPGYSEHQTGLAADFMTPSGAGLDNFCGTAQQVWMSQNAYKYGWIQRYTTTNSVSTGYDPECWHYRYIGKANAAAYISSGSISLETFWGVNGGLY